MNKKLNDKNSLWIIIITINTKNDNIYYNFNYLIINYLNIVLYYFCIPQIQRNTQTRY